MTLGHGGLLRNLPVPDADEFGFFYCMVASLRSFLSRNRHSENEPPLIGICSLYDVICMIRDGAAAANEGGTKAKIQATSIGYRY